MPALWISKGKKKRKKKGKKNENNKRKKRPRKSVESPPPSPPPSPPMSLGETSPAVDLEFKAAFSRCPAEININFRIPLNELVKKGIVTDRNNLLRTEESFKQSWDVGMNFPISYEELLSTSTSDPSGKEEVLRYLNSAAKNNYFDVPHPKERPDEMYQGFFVIYPEGQDQKDPIFGREPNLIKVVPLISKLGKGAVEYHNFMTGSHLQFYKFKKANLFFEYRAQIYFITLEATDNLSGKEVTCQSRVVCFVSYDDMMEIEVDPVPIIETFVEFFHRIED